MKHALKLILLIILLPLSSPAGWTPGIWPASNTSPRAECTLSAVYLPDGISNGTVFAKDAFQVDLWNAAIERVLSISDETWWRVLTNTSSYGYSPHLFRSERDFLVKMKTLVRGKAGNFINQYAFTESEITTNNPYDIRVPTWTATGLLAKVGAPTNYFDVTFYRAINGYGYSHTNAPVASGFTSASYGYDYLKAMISELKWVLKSDVLYHKWAASCSEEWEGSSCVTPDILDELYVNTEWLCNLYQTMLGCSSAEVESWQFNGSAPSAYLIHNFSWHWNEFDDDYCGEGVFGVYISVGLTKASGRFTSLPVTICHSNLSRFSTEANYLAFRLTSLYGDSCHTLSSGYSVPATWPATVSPKYVVLGELEASPLWLSNAYYFANTDFTDSRYDSEIGPATANACVWVGQLDYMGCSHYDGVSWGGQEGVSAVAPKYLEVTKWTYEYQ